MHNLTIPNTSLLISGSNHLSIRAIRIATAFPHVQVTGLDLTHPYPRDRLPDNLDFEVCDVNLGIDDHHIDKYDLVHVRFALSGFEDPLRTLRSLGKCTKKNGILCVVDMDYVLRDMNGHEIRPRFEGDGDSSDSSTGTSWLARVLYGSTLISC